jgi:hypothetical protein
LSCQTVLEGDLTGRTQQEQLSSAAMASAEQQPHSDPASSHTRTDPGPDPATVDALADPIPIPVPVPALNAPAAEQDVRADDEPPRWFLFFVALSVRVALCIVLLLLPALLGHSTLKPLSTLTGRRQLVDSRAVQCMATLGSGHTLQTCLELPRTVLTDSTTHGAGKAVLNLMYATAALCAGHCVQCSLVLMALALIYARYVGCGANESNSCNDTLAILASDLPYMLLGAFKISLQLLLNFLCLPVSFAALTTKLVLPYLLPPLNTVGTAVLFVVLTGYVQCALVCTLTSSMARVMLLRPEYQLQLMRTVPLSDGATSSLDKVLRNSILYLVVASQYMLAVVVVPLLLGRYLCPLPLPPDPSYSGSGLGLHLDLSVVLPGGWVLWCWDLAYLTLLDEALPLPGVVLFCQTLLVMFEQWCLRLAGLGHLAIGTAADTVQLYPLGTPQVALTVGERWRYLLVSKVRLLAIAVLSAWLHRAPLVVGRWAYYLTTQYVGSEYEAVSDLFLYPLGLVLTLWSVKTTLILASLDVPPQEERRWSAWLGEQLLYKGLGAGILLANLTTQVVWVLLPGWLTGLVTHKLGGLLGQVLGTHSGAETLMLYPAQLLFTGNAAWMALKW